MEQPNFNEFLASMTNNPELSNIMNNITNSLHQNDNNDNTNNTDNKQNNVNNNEDEEEEDYDELLYNLLTNEKEEPFPNILTRIDESLSNINKNFENQNVILTKICEHITNNK